MIIFLIKNNLLVEYYLLFLPLTHYVSIIKLQVKYPCTIFPTQNYPYLKQAKILSKFSK